MLGIYLDPTAQQIAVRRVLALAEIHADRAARRGACTSTSGSAATSCSSSARRGSRPSSSCRRSCRTSPSAPRRARRWRSRTWRRRYAFIQGRAFVIPEDVKAIAPDVLRHRLVLSYEAAAEQRDRRTAIIEQILGAVPVP